MIMIKADIPAVLSACQILALYLYCAPITRVTCTNRHATKHSKYATDDWVACRCLCRCVRPLLNHTPITQSKSKRKRKRTVFVALLCTDYFRMFGIMPFCA